MSDRTYAQDVARDDLRTWWESLTYEDKWEAFLIEKSNADALATPVPTEDATLTLQADDAGYVTLPDGSVFPAGRGHSVTIRPAPTEDATLDVDVWWTPDCGHQHLARNPTSITAHCPDGYPARSAPITESALAEALHTEFWDDSVPREEGEACCMPSARRHPRCPPVPAMIVEYLAWWTIPAICAVGYFAPKLLRTVRR